MKIRTLIVDDEPLALERLRDLLTAEPDIDLVGESSSGTEAVEAINSLKPDLVFLDVQMPELDGFQVLAALEQTEWPAIVFVTAYDRFALQAFDVHALDYLLKPFDRERFQKTLQRVRQHLPRRQTGELTRRLSALLSDLKPETKFSGRLAIKSQGRILFVKTDDIDWIEAADNYVQVHVGNESHLLRDTMSAAETKLDPNKFLRISRSTIVNVDRIKELQPLFHGEYAVILRNGTRLTLSRGYRDKLQELLGRGS